MRISNAIFILIILTVISAIVWIRVTEIEEIIRAEGQVEPKEQIQIVQPRFTGKLEKILVNIGDQVEKGQIVAQINKLEAEAQFRENSSTLDVLNAASSKWNFLNFRPGLVGGHCIGIDPYYLTWKAEQIGYKPQIVLSGREVNEKMTEYILGKIVDRLNKLEINLEETRILICGISFKEDCPDIRNSKVIDFINLSKDLGFRLNIYDPIADLIDLDLSIKKYVLKDFPNTELYDVIFIAVPHREIREIPYEKYNGILNLKGFIFDLKGILVKRNNIIHP